jgi:alginate O-acetyltransferase complex protein AlgI
MEFNSPVFLFLFLPGFMLLYLAAGQRLRLVFGILGSLLFYAWGNLVYIPLMVALTIGAYWLARGIDRKRGQRTGLFLLWAGILVNVGLLVTFKLLSGIPYPLGLSYVGFQVIAYLIEVYRRRVECELDLLKFSFFLLLFPKIPVGPIVRYRQVKEQISQLRPEPIEMADGLRRVIRGLAKKVLIADTLARVVNPIFGLASPVISPAVAWLVLVSYALQLYFDFSGYTDVAIGLGRMLGLTFVENFNFPYLSRSIGDFWRRWHISLASWFRDFVFYPLERRRIKWIGQPVNILVVFLLVGLWHGLARNFMIWGLIHGLALVFESTPLGRKVIAWRAPLGNIYALAVILFGWVFFRSPSPGFALQFLHRLSGDANGLTVLPFDFTSPLPFIEPSFVVALIAGLLFALPVGQWMQRVFEKRIPAEPALRTSGQLVYDLGLIVLLLASIGATASSTFMPGIYGKF